MTALLDLSPGFKHSFAIAVRRPFWNYANKVNPKEAKSGANEFLGIWNLHKDTKINFLSHLVLKLEQFVWILLKRLFGGRGDFCLHWPPQLPNTAIKNEYEDCIHKRTLQGNFSPILVTLSALINIQELTKVWVTFKLKAILGQNCVKIRLFLPKTTFHGLELG